MGGVVRKISICVVAVAAAALGCASKQRVALDCVPHDVTVYVDGRKLEKTPESIDLRADEAHTVFFKGGGYPPQMVVLRSEDVDGEARLLPADVCTEAVFVETRPEVQIKVEPGLSEEPG
ncbi:MAG: hypothetical protein JRS35_26485 [Deltaproteobacteria bacterium]|nr:hypothetical protein [Deltaproteobacteria bacterium]